MKLGFNIDYLLKRFGTEEKRSLEEAAKLLAEFGFEYVDYTSDLVSDDWEKRAANDRETLEKCGLKVNQTHAPMNRYGTWDNADFGELTRRAFIASHILGAKYAVTHADEYRTIDHYDPIEIREFEYDRLAPYAEYCAKNGMVMAIENVFEDRARTCVKIDGKSRFCSRIEELTGLIERFDSESVKCCWDFGHARCAFGNGQIDAMKQAGKYIVCTHVHDNYHGDDMHLMPFLGETNWNGHMKALKEMEYKGVLSFELVYGCLPDEMLAQFVSMVRQTGDKLIEMFES